MSDKKNARLILEDGTQFEGYSFGAETSVSGEVVFNTAMTGYPESLTDPSYSGQILVSTYPLIGNYGVPQFTEQDGLLRFFESDRIHIRALVVSDYSFEHSHWNASESLGQWLKDNGVPGIWGVDTRRITKIIRERGVMLGKLVIEGSPEPAEFVDPNKENLAALVSTKQVETYGNGKYRIVLVDCGCKYNIVRCLTKRNATVIRVPWDYDFTQIDYDGVMLSNGPGDPEDVTPVIHLVRELRGHVPIFGICLGHQLISLAYGAKTYKLKFGHRGINQPVKDLTTGKVEVTAHNHGFAVDAPIGKQVDAPFENGKYGKVFVSHIDLNDDVVEGLQCVDIPAFSVQYHPEAAAGPHDAAYLFDRFVDLMKTSKEENRNA